MFDWFKKDKETNVIPFPDNKLFIPASAPEGPATVYYRLGVTNNNRLAFQTDYSEITMNKSGVENLIRQLQVFRDQLTDEDDYQDEEND